MPRSLAEDIIQTSEERKNGVVKEKKKKPKLDHIGTKNPKKHVRTKAKIMGMRTKSQSLGILHDFE